MEDKVLINDRVYGKYEIQEPVIVELINTDSIQRLKDIHQFGMPQRFYPFPGYSRYEHSLGVMLTLKELGADLEEQVAGLLHDVSHTAFSHTVDWVVGSREKEDFQDKNLKTIITNSDIPGILMRHGIDTNRITEHDNYPLLERPAPYLCADRVDYTLRESKTWTAPDIVPQLVEDLTNYDGQIAFKTIGSAKNFAEVYARMQREHWAGVEATVRWELLARALKIGLEEDIITMEDFYTNDDAVISKLEQSNDQRIDGVISILRQEKLNVVENRENPQFSIVKKFRYIDPHYVYGSGVQPLSEGDVKYSAFLDEQRKINERGTKVDLIKK